MDQRSFTASGPREAGRGKAEMPHAGTKQCTCQTGRYRCTYCKHCSVSYCTSAQRPPWPSCQQAQKTGDSSAPNAQDLYQQQLHLHMPIQVAASAGPGDP